MYIINNIMRDGYKVVALGISFCTKEGNINGYKSVVIYTRDSCQ